MSYFYNNEEENIKGLHKFRTRVVDGHTLEKIARLAIECRTMVNANIILLKVVESAKERGEYQEILKRNTNDRLSLDLEKGG